MGFLRQHLVAVVFCGNEHALMWMKAGPAVCTGLLGWSSDGDFLMDGGDGRCCRQAENLPL